MTCTLARARLCLLGGLMLNCTHADLNFAARLPDWYICVLVIQTCLWCETITSQRCLMTRSTGICCWRAVWRCF